MTEATGSKSMLDELIEEQDWEAVKDCFLLNPDEAKRVHRNRGWTKLHWLCSIGSTPSHVIDLVAGLNPSAVVLPDQRYGDTPLHLAARHAQRTSQKMRCLLAHIPNGRDRRSDGSDEGLLVRNVFGGTVLHSACNHNAVLQVLQDLVAADPRILHLPTRDGIYAISALFTSYIQTIPGYMAVARILEGERLTDCGHFERFWNKVVFLSTAEYQQYEEEARKRMVLHGLLSCQILVNFYKLALKCDPSLASVTAGNGDTPLHVLVNRRPFRLKEREAIQATLEAFPRAASMCNNEGDLALFLAIRNKIPFENGMNLILEKWRSGVTYRDPETNLLPFQLAATVGGKVALENTWQLLLTQPDLLSPT